MQIVIMWGVFIGKKMREERCVFESNYFRRVNEFERRSECSVAQRVTRCDITSICITWIRVSRIDWTYKALGLFREMVHRAGVKMKLYCAIFEDSNLREQFTNYRAVEQKRMSFVGYIAHLKKYANTYNLLARISMIRNVSRVTAGLRFLPFLRNFSNL